MSHIQMRRNRIATLRGNIQSSFNAGLTINESKLVAEISLAFGISPKTILEDLKLLEISGLIKRWNGEIISPDSTKEFPAFDVDRISIDKKTGEVKT